MIRVDGGLVQNSFVCQFLSDMLERPVDVPVVTETTALGAAYLAGLHAGVFSSLDDISNAWVAQKNYSPSMAVDQKESLYNGWKTAVKRVLV